MASVVVVSGQQQRIKRREQQELSKGMEGAETIHRRDVGAALEAVSSQLTNVASSAKLAEASIAILNSAMGLNQFAGEKFNEPGGWFDRGKKQFEQEQRDFDAVTAAKSVLGSGRLGKGKRLVPPSFAAPGVSDSMPYGTGAPGDKGPTSVTVEGTMKGEGS